MTDDLIARLRAIYLEHQNVNPWDVRYEAADALEEKNRRLLMYSEALQDARDFIATTLAGIGDGHRIAELVQDFDYLLKGKEYD